MSKIEWLGKRGVTWNPITGCSKVSAGRILDGETGKQFPEIGESANQAKEYPCDECGCPQQDYDNGDCDDCDAYNAWAKRWNIKK